MSGDHPSYYTTEIVQNPRKSPGDLRRLAVTQTPVRNHQLTLVRKTRKRVNINYNLFAHTYMVASSPIKYK